MKGTEIKSEWLRLIVPNIITGFASLSALGALYIAYIYHSRYCAYLFLLSGICDAVDGPIARRLNAQTRFGTIFDSMSDFLAFGVAPALAGVFLDLLHPVIAAIYLLAIQVRLTRFTALPEEERKARFFRGLSAPDCVYMGLLFGLLFNSNYNWGFGVVSVLAIYPGYLWPKGLRILKLLPMFSGK